MGNHQIEAVILAGGKGSRLMPLTAEIPKPLVTVSDIPIIEILLTCMRKCGIRSVHIAVNHLAHLVESSLGNGDRFGIEILYSQEETPLSTVGPLKIIESLPEYFIVANGDIITDIDFHTLYDSHIKSSCSLTVATHTRKDTIDYGVLDVHEDGHVIGFREKPTIEMTVSMGVYVFSRSVLDHVPTNRPFGFDELMLLLLERDIPVNTFPYNGFWLDVGRFEDYELAQQEIKRIRKIIK